MIVMGQEEGRENAQHHFVSWPAGDAAGANFAWARHWASIFRNLDSR
jgi:hypothetical protein